MLTFKFYDSETNAIYDLSQTIEFIVDMALGNAADPIIFTISNINNDVCETCDGDNCYDGNADGGSCDDLDEDGICDDEDDCVGEYDCAGICNGENELDCAGICAGPFYTDECGNCVPSPDEN